MFWFIILFFGMIFGFVLLVVWMGLRHESQKQALSGEGAELRQRLGAVEHELAELRELVVDALIDQDDPRATRLAREIDRSETVDA